MRTRWMLAILLAAAAPGAAALAQATNDTGIPTETQERLRGGGDIDWANLIGLIGLFGLMGLRREHADDGYHPAPVE